MTKRKTVFGCLIAAFLILISGLVISFSSPVLAASADTETTKVYTLTFDYEYYRIYSYSYSGNFPFTPETWTDGQYAKLITGSDVTTVPIMHDVDGTKDFSISIYGEVPNRTVDSETLPKGACVNFKIVNIEVPSICQGAAAGWLAHNYRYRITQLSNSNGDMLVNDKFNTKWSDQGPTVVYTGELPEDTYTLHFEYSNWENDWVYYHKITTTFSVDRTPPTISGASTLPTGKYTNQSFTVTASDPAGIARLYYKSPSSSYYSSTTSSSKTISKGSTNGRYEFYAQDVNGNNSAVYYVNFDDTLPTLQCVGANFGDSTNGNFVVLANDNSGSVTLYYKENGGNWKASGSSFASERTTDDIVYGFYAMDDYGNKSEEVWVKATVLYGEFIKSDTDNSVYFTWEQPSWSAELDGSGYDRGTWIKDEGKHTVMLTSESNTALYSYTIDHYYVATMQEATCEESGFTTYECNQCGDNYTTFSTEELGHYYVASTVAATCTNGGYTVYTCTRCGDSYRDNETHKLGHIYLPSITAATCTNGGYTTYTCSRCGGSYTSGATQATGHSYITTSHAATCEEGSYTLHRCIRCGDSYGDNISQPLGHNYVTTTVPPTCTEYGKTSYECQVCGYNYADPDGTYPTGHNYTNTVTKTPTCTADGVRVSTCDNCGDSYETKIAANGHKYEITDIKQDNGNTTRTYTCETCGDSYKQELGDQYEEVSNYVEYLFQQYSPYMWWVLLASAGVWSVAIGIMIAIAHKNEDREKAKKMLVNYVVGLVVIAVIVVACPYLIRGIAALIT
ncbi:MAG: hypothetical protein NC131_05995 [Roseburia sp.]|nr:hypothetical protein [Roseburia sp.]